MNANTDKPFWLPRCAWVQVVRMGPSLPASIKPTMIVDVGCGRSMTAFLSRLESFVEHVVQFFDNVVHLPDNAVAAVQHTFDQIVDFFEHVLGVAETATPSSSQGPSFALNISASSGGSPELPAVPEFPDAKGMAPGDADSELGISGGAGPHDLIQLFAPSHYDEGDGGRRGGPPAWGTEGFELGDGQVGGFHDLLPQISWWHTDSDFF
jgi:hypothetical protein